MKKIFFPFIVVLASIFKIYGMQKVAIQSIYMDARCAPKMVASLCDLTTGEQVPILLNNATSFQEDHTQLNGAMISKPQLPKKQQSQNYCDDKSKATLIYLVYIYEDCSRPNIPVHIRDWRQIYDPFIKEQDPLPNVRYVSIERAESPPSCLLAMSDCSESVVVNRRPVEVGNPLDMCKYVSAPVKDCIEIHESYEVQSPSLNICSALIRKTEPPQSRSSTSTIRHLEDIFYRPLAETENPFDKSETDSVIHSGFNTPTFSMHSIPENDQQMKQ
jgi:hypothetical protein